MLSPQIIIKPNKKHFTYILILFFQFNSICQVRTFGTLPMIQVSKDEEMLLEDEDLNHTDAYDSLLVIYQKLVNARGDYRYPVPKLFLKEEESRGAYINYKTNNITVEKKAYDICVANGGDDALAYLLGHELTHYYEKHAWRNSFIRGKEQEKKIENATLNKRKQKNPTDFELGAIWNDIANETEADYLGGFLAYTAGYGMFENGGGIIEGLYSGYNLKDEINGYPSKDDRIELSNQSAKSLEELVEIFDMANILFASGMLEEAAEFYNHVLFKYQNRELYNNLGTLSVFSAMKSMEDELKFKYVTELDINFTGTRDVEEAKGDRISRLINLSISYFNAAINLDPNYAPAYLNKANAYALLKDWTKAKFYLEEEARPKALLDEEKYGKVLIDIIVLEGIIEAENGNKIDAAKLFNKAIVLNSGLAKLNLSLLNDSTKIEKTLKADPPLSTDKIGKISVASFFEDPTNDKQTEVGDNFTFHVLDKNAGEAKLFALDNKDTEFRTVFLMTRDGYLGKNDHGIGLNDDKSKLEVYGSPDFMTETTQGQILRFGKTLFFLKDNKVIKWIISGTERF